MDNFGRENEWQSQLQAIATQFLNDDKALSIEMDWLTSPAASSSFEFGYSLGSIDNQCRYLDFILKHSVRRETGFARGYVAGLIQAGRVDPSPKLIRDLCRNVGHTVIFASMLSALLQNILLSF